jgi:hypothetical protein
MQCTLLALALVVTAGASYAQTMPAGEPLDPYGRPFIGRSDWVRQPGDQPGPAGSGAVMAPQPQMTAQVATAPAAQPMAVMQPMASAPASAPPMPTSEKTTRVNKLERDSATGPEPVPMDATGPRQAAFKDEYGFRYDSQGNRLDARGNIISPHAR